MPDEQKSKHCLDGVERRVGHHVMSQFCTMKECTGCLVSGLGVSLELA